MEETGSKGTRRSSEGRREDISVRDHPEGLQTEVIHGRNVTMTRVTCTPTGVLASRQSDVDKIGSRSDSKKSSKTTSSKLSTRLRENAVEASKKIAELEKKLLEKQDEIDIAEGEVTCLEDQLEIFKSWEVMRALTHDEEASKRSLELQIVTSRGAVQRLRCQLSTLKKKFEIDKGIIADEEELNQMKIREDSSSDSRSGLDVESADENAVHKWVESQEVDNTEPAGKYVTQAPCYVRPHDPKLNVDAKAFNAVQNHHNPGAMPAGGGDMVNTLVSALHQAFGQQQGPQVITKQIDKDLPSFSGRPEDWLTFRSEYERMTRKYKYDDSENTVRLRKALKGAAKEAVNHLLANPNNVSRIMEVLENRFGRPEHVLDAMMQKAKYVKQPDLNKPETIIEFGTVVDSLVTNIVAFKQAGYLNNIQFLKDLVDRLPPILKRDWTGWITSNKMKPKDLVSFQEWILMEVEKAELTVQPNLKVIAEKEKDKKDHRGRAAFGAAVDSDKKSFCECCGRDNHYITKCRQFKAKKLQEKWDIVKDKKLCFCCLRNQRCRKKKTCEIDGCEKSHHRLLHNHDKDESDGSSSGKSTSPKSGVVKDGVVNLDGVKDGDGQKASVGAASSADLLPIIPVMLRGPKGAEKVYALLDTGASFCMLESDVAERLGLEGKQESLSFTVFGERRRQEDSQKISMHISGSFRNAPFYTISQAHTVTKLGLPGRTFDADGMKRRYPHLRKMRAKSMINAKPRMVIGMTELDLMVGREILETTSRKDPIAVRCKLGWFVGERRSGSHGFQFVMKTDDELHHNMKDFFSTESFGVKIIADSHRSQEDKRAMEILEKTTVKQGSRWETGLLWKSEDVVLPPSKQMAMNRLYSMERKMDKHESFAQLCEEKFEDYIRKGYLSPAGISGKEKRKWYLPWFFAYHPTKKPRLVFDAAAKTSGPEGKSLNDYLLKGPDLLRPLAAVLMRFRMHKIAITGDIREMFHQVRLKTEDKPCQTILYRGRRRDIPPVEYEMQVLFFGSASSPCSSIFTKDRNAEVYSTSQPEAVKAIQLDHYVDDYLGGSNSVDGAIKLRKAVSEIHASGGFTIAKWSSNSIDVLQTIPEELQASGVTTFSEKAEIEMEKTLGLLWDPQKDEFSFHLNFRRVPEEVKAGMRRPTKREMASLIMSLYDPLGFLCPYKIRALAILQQTWILGIGWEDEIVGNVADQWDKWLQDLPTICDVRVPRCYTQNLYEAENVQLHTFCDASEEAFAAVVYLRVVHGRKVKVAFVAGKTRIAPIKSLTVPRMELQAAVMGSRLANTVHASFSDDVKINSQYFWSDSKTVLCWLRSTSSRYNQFVSNRIGEIHELTDVNQWKWISTLENAADDSTRATRHVGLSSKSRWLCGPDFLLKSEEEWPKENKKETEEDVIENDLERKVISFAFHEDSSLPVPDMNRFSSWMRLVRAAAMVIVAVKRFKGEKAVTSVADMEKAEVLLMKKCQEDSFCAEVSTLKLRKVIGKKSRLYRLSPVLSEKGLIVINGRINNAELDLETRNPVILDPKHEYTKMLIKWHHKVNGHYGQETVLNQLRRKVWILDGRAAVRKCWAQCFECQKRKLAPVIPEMGQLPVCRLGDGRQPFFHTGVDYFGPLQVMLNRRVHKRWGVIFTCMSTRAVYLDLAEQLDTNEMINAYARFIAVRGPPAHLWSDNGSNFICAEKEMKAALRSWNVKAIEENLAVKGIQWHWNPPASPHMGPWERQVGSVKKILRGMLKSQTPRESVLRTLLYEAMNIINNRPLTYVSTDPDDPECITPNHLLKMRCMEGASIPGDYDDGDKLRKSWRFAQRLADEFWRKWTTGFLPALLKREKWHDAGKPIEVGDLVLVVNDQLPRSDWKKGVIVAVYPAKDGKVRIVDVKVAVLKDNNAKEKVTYRFYRRSIVKIIPLGLRCPVAVATGEGEMSLSDKEV